MLIYLRWFSFLFLYIAMVIVGGCARGPIKNTDQAMRPASRPPQIADDLEFNSLVTGLEANIAHFKNKADPGSMIKFGPRSLRKDEYLASLEHLLTLAKQDSSGERLKQSLASEFEAFEVYGQSDWGEVFITSYFEPVINGSRRPSKQFTQPLYGLPKEMVVIDLDSFASVRPSLAALRESPLEQRSRSNSLRGLLMPAATNSEPSKVIPFPDRAQIQSGRLKGQAMELAWVDPIDAFFLEIQGSGVVRLEDGSDLTIGYAAQNGHPYVPIGKHLTDAIPKEKMSMQTIEAHLRSLPLEESQKIMNLNPSYVFFKPVPKAGISFFGTEVIPGRTIATDHSFFPKGTLALLEFNKPEFASSEAIEPQNWKPAARLVFDQDTGGAIRGPHRVDLFWGRGSAAKQAAGVMKNKGRLTYFVPRPQLLQRLFSTSVP